MFNDLQQFIGGTANTLLIILGWAILRIIGNLDTKIKQIDDHLEQTDYLVNELRTQVAVLQSKTH